MKMNFKIFITSLILILFTQNVISTEENSSTSASSSSYKESAVTKYAKNGYKIRCFWLIGVTAYNLSPLKNEGEEGSVDKTIEISKTKSIDYNFCVNNHHKCKDKKDESKVGMAFSQNKIVKKIKDKETGKTKDVEVTECKVLAGSIRENNKWSVIRNVTDNSSIGVQIDMNLGEECDDKEKHYQLTYKILCDRDMKYGEIVWTNSKTIQTNTCNVEILAKSYHGCAMDNFYAVSAFIDNNKIIFCIVFLLIGIFLNFLGVRVIRITIVLAAFFISIEGIFILLFGIIQISTVSTGVMWIILVCSILVSLVVAFLFFKYMKAFFVVLGCILGYIIGTILYTFVLRYIQVNPHVAYWVTLVLCSVIGGLVSFFARKHFQIIATSSLGSYIFIRGISFVTGKFPSEGTVVDLIKRKEFDQISEVSFLYCKYIFNFYIIYLDD